MTLSQPICSSRGIGLPHREIREATGDKHLKVLRLWKLPYAFICRMVTKWADGELAPRRCREACAASKMTPDVVHMRGVHNHAILWP